MSWCRKIFNRSSPVNIPPAGSLVPTVEFLPECLPSPHQKYYCAECGCAQNCIAPAPEQVTKPSKYCEILPWDSKTAKSHIYQLSMHLAVRFGIRTLVVMSCSFLATPEMTDGELGWMVLASYSWCWSFCPLCGLRSSWPLHLQTMPQYFHNCIYLHYISDMLPSLPADLVFGKTMSNT